MFLEKYYKIIIVIFIFLIIIGFIIFINFDSLGHNGNRNNNDTIGYDIEYSDPIKEYYCLDGYTLSNGKCYSIIAKVDAAVEYYCEKGIAVGATCDLGGLKEFMSTPDNGNNQEFKSNCIADGGYYVTEDGILKCKKWIDEKVQAEKKYRCYGDSELSGSKCIYYSYIDALYNLTCEEGYVLKNNKCEKYIYK